MSDPLRPIHRPRLYEQVVASLREYVSGAGLRTGDRLPTERELAERLGVSRASVKQAVVVLEVQGLVEVRRGGGTYLRRDSLAAEPVAELVERRRRLPDVLDAREALETKLAALAAERRTEADLLAMEEALSIMQRDIEAGGLGMEGDLRFHAAVTAAAHSSWLAEFMAQMSEQIAESRAESLRQQDRPGRSLRQHWAITEAIRERHAGRAASAMRRHLRTVSRVRLLSWQPEGEDSR